MTPLLRVAAVRRIEQAAAAALPAGALMERAAQAVAEAAAGRARTLGGPPEIVALVGPGNNGGDALLAAMHLAERGWAVRAVVPDPQAAVADGAADARAVHARWQAGGGTLAGPQALAEAPAAPRLWLDGLFGIGLSRPIAGAAAALVARVAADGGPVIAIDVPSGLDADRGSPVGGREGVVVAAEATVTMIAGKPGLWTGAGLQAAGRCTVATLGLDDAVHAAAAAADSEDACAAWEQEDALRAWPAAGVDVHKGSFGQVLVDGGGRGLEGALLLAARGAQAVGAGKVFVRVPEGEAPFDPREPQLMRWPAEAVPPAHGVRVVGCGLGTGEAAVARLAEAIAAPGPLVLDADALNLLAAGRLAWRARAAAPTVLTPHPLEAARLLGTTTADIQADRWGAVRALATRFDACVVLKGAGTLVAAPRRPALAVAGAVPALASAGTGDVLAGILGGLLARGVADAFEAAALGAWLHAQGGALWQTQHRAAAGLSAAELPSAVRQALDRLVAGPAARSPLTRH